jgi:hypothetical protein
MLGTNLGRPEAFWAFVYWESEAKKKEGACNADAGSFTSNYGES